MLAECSKFTLRRLIAHPATTNPELAFLVRLLGQPTTITSCPFQLPGGISQISGLVSVALRNDSIISKLWRGSRSGGYN